jgi:hypothetical protein
MPIEADDRYLVMVKDPKAENPSIFRGSSLDGISKTMAARNAVHCTILDLVLLAETIAKRAGLPLMRIEVECAEGGKCDAPRRPAEAPQRKKQAGKRKVSA